MIQALPDAATTPLQQLVVPETVAVIGASNKPGTWGHNTATNLLVHSDVPGGVWFVNPRGGSIHAHPVHRSVRELPAGRIDVAVVLVPAEQTLGVLDECAEAGIPFAIVCTSGLAEGPTAGSERAALAAFVERTGVRIYGPSSPGLTNVNAGIGMTMAAQFPQDTRGGPIGLVTQGGALGRTLMQGVRPGRGIGLWASTGSEVDLCVADFVMHLAAAPDIEVIAVVLEGIREGRRFQRALRQARCAGKPVLVLKVGRTAEGAQAALSHTGAVTGADDVFDAILRREGAVRVDGIDELLDTAHLLTDTDVAGSQRVAVISLSGGAAALAVDSLSRNDVLLASLQRSTVTQLAEVLPSYAHAANPLDVTSAAFVDQDLHRRALSILGADAGVQLILAPIPADYAAVTERVARDIVAADASGQRVVPVWMSARRGPAYRTLVDAGLPVFDTIDAACRALGRRQRWLAARGHADPGPPAVAVPVRTWPWADRPSVGPAEDEVRELLRDYGIPGPAEQVTTSAAEAVAAARQLGYPVVLKARTGGAVHKADLGGVALDLADDDHVARAFERITAQTDLAGRGVIVASMAPPGIELLISVFRDADFGHIITVGAGGVLVDVLARVAQRPVPLIQGDVPAMLDEGGLAPLLRGARGSAPSDVSAVQRALLGLSRLATDHGDHFSLLEINPLRVLPEGEGVSALDAVLVTTPTDEGRCGCDGR